MEYLVEAIKYVVSAPYFWGSMGFITAIAMFFGSVIYNGEVPKAKKGILSVLAYGFMILWVTFSRLSSQWGLNYMYEKGPNGIVRISQSLAGPLTIFFVTVFWLFGVWLGIKVFCMKNNRCK